MTKNLLNIAKEIAKDCKANKHKPEEKVVYIDATGIGELVANTLKIVLSTNNMKTKVKLIEQPYHTKGYAYFER